MARTLELQSDFSLGMKPDLPPDQLPKGAVVNLVDFIPNLYAPLTARAGWNRVGASLGDSYVASLAFAPFAAAGQLVGITDLGAIKQIAYTGSTVTARGSMTGFPYGSPAFYREKLYIPSSAGSTNVKSYDGSTNAADAAGTPPQAMFATVYKDHLVLARSSANPQRVWFSNGGDAGVWDTAADGQWLDASQVITGLATLRNMILVFGEERMERLRGDIIPGVAGSDMVKEPAFSVGTGDPASIAVTDDFCVFANGAGIYLTDGVGLVDLTVQGDIKQWWRDEMYSYDAAWTIAGGIFRGYYICSVMNGSTFKFCLVCDIARRSFFRFSNLGATTMATSPSGLVSSFPGNVWFGERGSSNAADVSTMWEVQNVSVDDDTAYTGPTGDDGNGTWPSPKVRLGYLKGRPGLKRWRRLYVTYSLYDVGVDPSLTVKVYNDPSYYTGFVESGTLSFTALHQTKRLPVSLTKARSDGIGVEVSASQPQTHYFRIYGFDAEVQPLEQSRG